MRKYIVESSRNAKSDIPKMEKRISFFGITRGQYSMIDIILKCLDDLGPSKISLWTWVIADYEVQVFERLMRDGRLRGALLVVDSRARSTLHSKKANGDRVCHDKMFRDWISKFGVNSIRFVLNHAKIATIEQVDVKNPLKLLIRGSMNLNFNPRFEQYDIDEGHPGFDLVKKLEQEFPVLSVDHSFIEARKASGLDRNDIKLFDVRKVWEK